jgi:DNA-binding MarR family transcriptional regulator
LRGSAIASCCTRSPSTTCGYRTLPSCAALSDFGPLAQYELAARLDVLRSRLVGYVDLLEQRRFVQRERDLEDRRRQNVRLTESGRELWQRLQRVAEHSQTEFLDALSELEWETLLTLLSRVLQAHDEARLRADAYARSASRSATTPLEQTLEEHREGRAAPHTKQDRLTEARGRQGQGGEPLVSISARRLAFQACACRHGIWRLVSIRLRNELDPAAPVASPESRRQESP